MLSPGLASAKTSVTAGLTTSYDYEDRKYDSASNDTSTGATGDQSTDDKNEWFSLTPLIGLKSEDVKNQFELRATPSFKYSFEESDTDVDARFFLSESYAFTKKWYVGLTDKYTRSDYYQEANPASSDSGNVDSNTPQTTDTGLSSDPGRQRFWKNNVTLTSQSIYGNERFVNLLYSYDVLRNEEDNHTGYNDYDRHQVGLNNQHRINTFWKTLADFRVVNGDYENSSSSNSSSASTSENLSTGLMEYHFLGRVTNSLKENDVSLEYNYTGTRFDEDQVDDSSSSQTQTTVTNDSDIHQGRLTWQRQFLRQFNVKLGGGYSYVDVADQDSQSGGNGIAEVAYIEKNGSVKLSTEKRYDVDNFNGTTDRGFIDIWETKLDSSYFVVEDLSLHFRFSYIYEDRQNAVDSQDSTSDTTLDTTHQDRVMAGVGLSYSFLKNYVASLNYTVRHVESDISGDNYDDHRVLLSLSWEQELLRW